MSNPNPPSKGKAKQQQQAKPGALFIPPKPPTAVSPQPTKKRSPHGPSEKENPIVLPQKTKVIKAKGSRPKSKSVSRSRSKDKAKSRRKSASPSVLQPVQAETRNEEGLSKLLVQEDPSGPFTTTEDGTSRKVSQTMQAAVDPTSPEKNKNKDNHEDNSPPILILNPEEEKIPTIEEKVPFHEVNEGEIEQVNLGDQDFAIPDESDKVKTDLEVHEKSTCSKTGLEEAQADNPSSVEIMEMEEPKDAPVIKDINEVHSEGALAKHIKELPSSNSKTLVPPSLLLKDEFLQEQENKEEQAKTVEEQEGGDVQHENEAVIEATKSQSSEKTEEIEIETTKITPNADINEPGENMKMIEEIEPERKHVPNNLIITEKEETTNANNAIIDVPKNLDSDQINDDKKTKAAAVVEASKSEISTLINLHLVGLPLNTTIHDLKPFFTKAKSIRLTLMRDQLNRYTRNATVNFFKLRHAHEVYSKLKKSMSLDYAKMVLNTKELPDPTSSSSEDEDDDSDSDSDDEDESKTVEEFLPQEKVDKKRMVKDWIRLQSAAPSEINSSTGSRKERLVEAEVELGK